MSVLSEWKSVSDNTLASAAYICSEILKRVKNANTYIGEYFSIPLKKGEFMYDVRGFFRNINELKIEYCIYYCENESQYDILLRSGMLSCMSDYGEGYIVINLAYVKGRLKDEFLDDVNHEINHILQTDNGAVKNEDLYEKCIEIINDKSLGSNVERSPAYMVYYTFRTEEDSITVQFYSFLKRTYKKIFDTSQTEFEKCRDSFNLYKNITNAYYMSIDNICEKEVINVIERMGMTTNSWRRRIEQGMKRLNKKLKHAYDRACIENSRMMTLDNVVRANMLLYESYGNLQRVKEPYFSF